VANGRPHFFAQTPRYLQKREIGIELFITSSRNLSKTEGGREIGSGIRAQQRACALHEIQ
jgi:hypothetical protein